MNWRSVATVAALTTLALAAVRGAIAVAGEWGLSLLAEWGVPAIGAAGQNVTLYVSVLDGLGPLVTVAVSLGLGVSLGRRVDVRNAHRELLAAVAAGSGAVAGVAGVAAYVAGGPLSAYGVLFGAVMALRVLATLTLPLLVGALAGAALVAFEREDGADGGARAGPARPTDERDVERSSEHSADHAGAD
jgi:hypothetical protein